MDEDTPLEHEAIEEFCHASTKISRAEYEELDPSSRPRHGSEAAASSKFHLVFSPQPKKPKIEKLEGEKIQSVLGESITEMADRDQPFFKNLQRLFKNKEKDLRVQDCVDTINGIFENIIQRPTEEKYRRIRIMSKTFQENVYYIEGSKELLTAAGFQLVQLPGPDGNEEDYYVLMDFDEKNIKMLQQALNDAETFPPEFDRSLPVARQITQLPDHIYDLSFKEKPEFDRSLPVARQITELPDDIYDLSFKEKPEFDRRLRVLSFSVARQILELPDEFYNFTLEDLKKEQELRKDVGEQEQMLETKAMRDREAQRKKPKYRYTNIRIRFPDDIILQGTFKVNEKLRDVYSFIQEALEEHSRPFVLMFSRRKLLDQDVSLLDLELVPSVTLHFQWYQPSAKSGTRLLKETILTLLEDV